MKTDSKKPRDKLKLAVAGLLLFSGGMFVGNSLDKISYSVPPPIKLRVPHKEGGLPLPFAKYVVGYNKEWPAKVEFHSIGPMFYNAQVRAPTEEEGNWYVSRLKKLKE